ncbi:Esterase/lipase/thioesterase family protein [Arabidopsis thaliana]|uniref:Esterase/lipase/thioesterase family protein n=1 Tax=Arabidopsis thaliana TaxID=3702 RepID=F4JDQ6_ARATH|nr:Esterase/lipase/thioesterase family protein [Arabidopsis thaliana]AEE77219.1 Esterase/lipase/thioesterase family protein [Arabidopsis thaliana]|eukprot:NP_189317.1 Esterase/lipase/thioesterase family protein [Arabidopsis thaliana]
MGVTLLRSIFGLCAVSSSSRVTDSYCSTKSYLRRRRTSASKQRLTEIKSVTSTPPPPSREARDFVGDGGGPPRWFSPLECRAQAPNSPLLLFLPGIDGTGLGLIRHHKKLGEIFDIWCLHIPVSDRTPFKDLVKLIERTVKSENYRFPNRPIYLVGESIGACLALDVAARNPNVDLALILVNPATHVNNFMSKPLLGMLNVLPDGIPTLWEDVFGFKQGAPLTGILEAMSNEFSVQRMGGVGGGMLRDLFAVSANLPTLSRMFSKDTLLWKLEMLKSAIASVNSHIYSVKAETLILPSGRDQWLLNEEDIVRYSRTLPNCIVRKLDDNGQFPLLEDSLDLATIIKLTCFYRRGKSHDYVSDYIKPTPFELQQLLDEHRLLMDAISPVMLSTLEDGLLLKERNIHMRGLTHPMVFMYIQDSLVDPKMFDKYKLMGGVPVSNMNFYKLLREKAHVLLYPGGVREALHRKGEEYKLFWPEQSEFVRVASKFGAKIVPFGVVGEDDIFNIVLDSNDQRNIPILKDLMEKATKDAGNLRWKETKANWETKIAIIPGLVPKIPGRFYYYFGKPIDLAGKEKELKDKEKAQEVYLQAKSEVEQCIAYLKMKRECDPYRQLLPRMMYQASHGWSCEIPTFDL